MRRALKFLLFLFAVAATAIAAAFAIHKCFQKKKLFFFRHLSLLRVKFNLFRVKYVWKNRYSFPFFEFYCTKNVNSQNATTSNKKKLQSMPLKESITLHREAKEFDNDGDDDEKNAMWLLCILLNQTTEFC